MACIECRWQFYLAFAKLVQVVVCINLVQQDYSSGTVLAGLFQALILLCVLPLEYTLKPPFFYLPIFVLTSCRGTYNTAVDSESECTVIGRKEIAITISSS